MPPRRERFGCELSDRMFRRLAGDWMNRRQTDGVAAEHLMRTPENHHPWDDPLRRREKHAVGTHWSKPTAARLPQVRLEALTDQEALLYDSASNGADTDSASTAKNVL